MLFYKHLCSFWKRYSCMYASILVQLSSFVHDFLFPLFLFAFFLFIGIFFSSLSIREKEKKASYYCCCLFFFSLSLSFSLSRKYFLLLYIYTYIYQSEEVRVLTRRFFLLVLAKFSPDITIILILLFPFVYMPTYKNRVCIYVHTHKKESAMVYIYKRAMYDSLHILVDISSSDSHLLI